MSYTFKNLFLDVYALSDKNRPSAKNASVFKTAVWAVLYERQADIFKEATGLELDEENFKSNDLVRNVVENNFFKVVGPLWKSASYDKEQLFRNKPNFFNNVIDFSGENFNCTHPTAEEPLEYDEVEPMEAEPMDTSEEPPRPFVSYSTSHQHRITNEIKASAHSDEALYAAAEKALRANKNHAGADVLKAIKHDNDLAKKVREFIKKPDPNATPRMEPSEVLSLMMERNFSVKDIQVLKNPFQTF